MEIYLGQKARHKDLYGGNETFEVIGITFEDVLLKGDFSGGTQKVEQESWISRKGLILQNRWGFWIDPDDDFFKGITKNAGRRD